MNFTGDTEGGIPQTADGLDGCVGPPDVLILTNSYIWILQAIQKAVYRNLLTDSMDVLDHLMSRENIMPRLNQRILSSATNPVRAVIYTFLLRGGHPFFLSKNISVSQDILCFYYWSKHAKIAKRSYVNQRQTFCLAKNLLCYVTMIVKLNRKPSLVFDSKCLYS
jgi:hypothetical protein